MEQDVIMLQEYLIHLLDGTIIRCSEDYETPNDQSVVTRVRKAAPTDVFTVGNAFDGYKYIPKSSILYLETGDVVEEPPRKGCSVRWAINSVLHERDRQRFDYLGKGTGENHEWI